MKLTIKNYQAHELSELEFQSPGINAITGPNGHGKSSIIRALRSVPLGESLDRRHGTKETRVDIDGVCRSYVSGKNQYEIGSVTHKALRSAVPKEVFDQLKLSAVNFRSQHQPYFLLHDSPGAVARAMNDLTDLGVIDYVASAFKAESRLLEDIKKKQEADLNKEQQKLDSYSWVDEAQAGLHLIESLQASIQEEVSWILTTQEIITQVNQLRGRLEKFPPASVFLAFDDKLAELQSLNTDKLASVIYDVISHRDWLEASPESMLPQLDSSLQTLSKAFETGSLATLIEQITEYALDLELCPDPKPDISRSCDVPALEETTLLSDIIGEAQGFALALAKIGPTEDLLQWSALLGASADALRRHEIERVEVKNVITVAGDVHGQLLYKQTECIEAREEYKLLLEQTGTCPLCGGQLNEDCVYI